MKTNCSLSPSLQSSAHASSHDSSQRSSGPISCWNSCQSSCSESASASVAGRMDTEAGEEVMGGEVLKRCEACAERADVVDGTIECGHRLAQAEVARGPRFRPCQVTGQIPIGRPLAEPAHSDELRLHLVVGQHRERLEVELGTCQPDDVLRLAARETD